MLVVADGKTIGSIRGDNRLAKTLVYLFGIKVIEGKFSRKRNAGAEVSTKKQGQLDLFKGGDDNEKED